MLGSVLSPGLNYFTSQACSLWPSGLWLWIYSMFLFFFFFFLKKIKKSWKVLSAEKERRGRRNKRHGVELTGREGVPDQVPPQGRRLPHLYSVFSWWSRMTWWWPSPRRGACWVTKVHSARDWRRLPLRTLLGGTARAPGWLPRWDPFPSWLTPFHPAHSTTNCICSVNPALQQTIFRKTAQLKWPWKTEGPWTFLDSNFNFARSYRTNNDFS